MNFFLLRGGNQLGPYPMSSLAAMRQSGNVLPTDYIWVEGAPSWVPVSDYLAPGAAAGSPPALPKPSAAGPESPLAAPPPLPPASQSLDAASAQMIQEVEAGGRFVVFMYCISVIILTFRRSSDIVFLRRNEDGAGDAIRYSLLSGVAGWWGFPWGPIYTIAALISNARGGRDVTREVLLSKLGPEATAAILARRQKPARAGLMMNLFRVGLIAVPVLFIGLVFTLSALPEGTGGSSRGGGTPGEVAFTKANRLININEGPTAFGNSEQAIALAGNFSRSMKALQAVGFKSTGGSSRGYSASKHEFLTFCDLRPHQCIILVHVPELRRYSSEAKDTLCDLCWMSGQAALRNQNAGTNGMKVVIGVRGIALYDRVMTGTYVADAKGGNNGLASTSRGAKELLPGYFDDALNRPAAPAESSPPP